MYSNEYVPNEVFICFCFSVFLVGNIALKNLSEEELSKKFLCNRHFLPDSYKDGIGKSRLNDNAMPIHYCIATGSSAPEKMNVIKLSEEMNPPEEMDVIDLSEEVSSSNINVSLSPLGMCLSGEGSGSGSSSVTQDVDSVWNLKPPLKDYGRVGEKKSFEDLLKTPDTPQLLGITRLTTEEKKEMNEEIDMPDRMKSRKRLVMAEDETPRKKKMRLELKFLRKKVAIKNQRLYRLKNRAGLIMTKYRNRVDELLASLPKNSAALVSMQLKGKFKKKDYSKAERKLAMSLYYKSPSTYSYMRRSKIFFPGESTIRKWIHSNVFEPGINENLFEHLELKCAHMNPLQKACVILFDEMSIMKALEYSKNFDYVEGFQDLGALIGRSLAMATHALVIMIRGLYSQSKLPVAYFLTSENLDGQTLKLILEQSVINIIKIGFVPKIMTCDRGPTNRKVYSLWDISPTNNKIKIGGCEIFCMYDVPHLFKSIRNNLLTGNFIDQDGNTVSFEDIRLTYKIDIKSTTARAMPKITPAHLNPNPFQKMTCKLALQLFSNTVAGAVKTAADNGELSSTTARTTAAFLADMNDLFDSMNSRYSMDPHPRRKPLSADSMWHFIHFSKMLKYFENLQKISSKNGKMSRPPCFEGIMLTMKSIQDLFQQEIDVLEYKPFMKNYFLLTGRLNQDPLENFFSVVRQKNGYNRNPTSGTGE